MPSEKPNAESKIYIAQLGWDAFKLCQLKAGYRRDGWSKRWALSLSSRMQGKPDTFI